MLSMCIPTWSYEAAETTPWQGVKANAAANPPVVGTALDTPFTIKMRDTSCVERIYVMAMLESTEQWDDPGADAAAEKAACEMWGRPLELTDNLRFSSNGQTHFELPTKVLQCYGHPKQGGSAGFSGSQAAHTFQGQSENGLGYVYCIELSPDDGQDSDHISNLLSLRELSNPQIHGVIKALALVANGGTSTQAQIDAVATHQVTIRVAYSRRELASIVSSNGRYSVSLSN
jgi:hypothetical protein